METKKNQKSETERISFYTEIGQFFTPDGSFNEPEFTGKLKEALKEKKKEFPETDDFLEHTGAWLSSYLTEMLDYLLDKNMPDAASSLLRASIAETAAYNLTFSSLSSRHLDLLLSDTAAAGRTRGERISRNEKREKIFAAALSVFEKETFRKATMDRIADAAGIGKASVYRLFKNKEELLDELLNRYYGEIVKNINTLSSGEGDVLEQIKKMISYWIGFISENPALYQLIQTETNSEGISNKVIYYDYLASNLPMFKENLVAQNREMKIRSVNFYSVFYGILGYIDGIFIKWYRNGKQYDLKDEIPGIEELLFYGILVKNSTGH